jgi:hypothetical protein
MSAQCMSSPLSPLIYPLPSTATPADPIGIMTGTSDPGFGDRLRPGADLRFTVVKILTCNDPDWDTDWWCDSQEPTSSQEFNESSWIGIYH